MTRRWSHRIGLWAAVWLLSCGLWAVGEGTSVWAEEAPEVSSQETGDTVAQEVVEEAARRAGDAAEGEEKLPEGEEADDGGASEEADDDGGARSEGRTLPEQDQQVSGGALVIVTYLLLWLMLGAFLLVTLWRQAKLRRDVEMLERRIDDLLGDS